MNKKYILIVIIIIVIAAIIGGIIIWQQLKPGEIPGNQEEKQEVQQEDPDIKGVKQSFEMIRKGNKGKDMALMREYFTTETNEALDLMIEQSTSWNWIWYADMEITKIVREEPNIIIVTVKNTGFDGEITEQDIIFIEEDGIWKMALMESLEKELQEWQNEN